MKSISFSALVLTLAIPLLGQNYFDHVKQNAWSLSLTVFSGASDGAADAIKHHYNQTWLPQSGRGEQFWNPAISWQNKHKDWPTDQREAFWGSKTIGVFLTDGWHLLKFGRNKSATGAVLTYRRPSKRAWFILDFLVHSAAFSVGWHLGDRLLKL